MQTPLPETFRPILWSHDFDRIDPVKHRKTIIVQAINYGTLAQWRWLRDHYGHDGVRTVLGTIPASELRPRVRRLAALSSAPTNSTMHREVLTEPAAALFPFLSRFPGFYLAGGTALALQIGHRVSVDFDLFCDNPIEPGLLRHVQRAFAMAEMAPLVNNADELTLLVNSVKITFLHYPFPAGEGFVSYEGVPLLSVPEIAATKAYTIGRRGSYRDYVDLYFVVAEEHVTLADMIARADRKFGDAFNARLFLEQLVYVADLDDTELHFLKPAVTPVELQQFFANRIREAADSL